MSLLSEVIVSDIGFQRPELETRLIESAIAEDG